MADTSCLFSLFRTDFSQYDHRSTAKFYVFVPSQRACACTHMFIKREINFYQQYLVRSVYVRALKRRSFYFKNWYFIISVFSNACQISASLFTILFLPLSPFVSLLSSYSSFRQLTLNTRWNRICTAIELVNYVLVSTILLPFSLLSLWRCGWNLRIMNFPHQSFRPIFYSVTWSHLSNRVVSVSGCSGFFRMSH